MTRYLFPGDLVLLPDGDPAASVPFTWWSDPVAGSQYTDMLAADGISTITLTTDSNGLRPYMYGPDGVELMYCDTGIGIRFPVYAADRGGTVFDQAALLNVEQTFIASQHFSGGLTVPADALPISAVTDLANQISAAAAEGLLAQAQVLSVPVLSVNSIGPDGAGNVVVAGGGGGGSVDSVNNVAPDGGGNVTLTKVDISLGNVDNVSDLNKPLSTAATTALAGKAVDTEISTVNIQAPASTVRNLISGRRFHDGYIAEFITFGQYYTVFYTGSAWPALSTVHASYIAAGRPIIWDSQTYLSAAEPSEARNGDFWDKQVA